MNIAGHIHRTCDQTIASRTADLRESRIRASQLAVDLSSERNRSARRLDLFHRASNDLLNARIDHTQTQADRDRIAAELADTRERLDRLQARYDELTKTQQGHKAVLEERRARAAEVALGSAWRHPGDETCARRAEVARTLLDMPLSFYDVIVSYDPDAPHPWYVDSRPVTDHVGFYADAREYLTRRYGVSEAELESVQRAAERARQENQWEGAF